MLHFQRISQKSTEDAEKCKYCVRVQKRSTTGLATANAVSELAFSVKSLSLPRRLPPSSCLSLTQQAF